MDPWCSDENDKLHVIIIFKSVLLLGFFLIFLLLVSLAGSIEKHCLSNLEIHRHVCKKDSVVVGCPPSGGG